MTLLWHACGQLHTPYTGTVSQHYPLVQALVVLRSIGISKDEAMAALAREVWIGNEAVTMRAMTWEPVLLVCSPR